MSESVSAEPGLTGTPGPARSRPLIHPAVAPIAIAIVTFCVYRWSYQGEGAHFDYFVRLSDAFLHGRTDFVEHPPWLNELIPFEGKYYCVFPPMPAFLLMPFVKIFGSDLSQPTMSMLLGAASAALSYLVLSRWFAPALALTGTVLFAFGTNYWYHCEVGSGWYFAQICAVFFLWLALLELVTRKRPFLIGLAVAAAMLSRLPTTGALAFFVVMLWPDLVSGSGGIRTWRLHVRPALELAGGVLPAALITAWYNQTRFGSPTQFGYSLIPGVLDEPWYRHGISSVHYVPGHLKELFWSFPAHQDSWPYLIPKISIMALWVTTPAVVLVLLAPWRNRLTWAAAAGVVCTLPFHLTHGENGFAQFGNRFSLDYVPFLVILMVLGMRERLRWWVIALVALSIVANIWGVVMLSRQGYSIF
jgi:hypothetical protein